MGDDAYLFSRKDWTEFDDLDGVSLATHVFFQMWQKRTFPYLALKDGDLVYIGDTRTRTVRWEVGGPATVENPPVVCARSNLVVSPWGQGPIATHRAHANWDANCGRSTAQATAIYDTPSPVARVGPGIAAHEGALTFRPVLASGSGMLFARIP